MQIFETGETSTAHFIVLEYMSAGNLASRLNGRPQPERQCTELTHTIARAVEYAHGRGVIHRDLKPSNVLLAADGTLKIADFGLAKLLDVESNMTASGDALGTPSYMAPEQTRGKFSERTDIYALGAILYELLTGRPPFAGETTAETLVQVQTREPIAPRWILREGLSRPGSHLPEVLGERARATLRLGPGGGRRSGALSRRPTDGRPAAVEFRTRPALGDHESAPSGPLGDRGRVAALHNRGVDDRRDTHRKGGATRPIASPCASATPPSAKEKRPCASGPRRTSRRGPWPRNRSRWPRRSLPSRPPRNNVKRPKRKRPRRPRSRSSSRMCSSSADPIGTGKLGFRQGEEIGTKLTLRDLLDRGPASAADAQESARHPGDDARYAWQGL